MSTEREQPVDLLAALLESIQRRSVLPAPAEPAAPTHDTESDGGSEG